MQQIHAFPLKKAPFARRLCNRNSSLDRDRLFGFHAIDRPAAEANVSLVKHNPLSRCHRPLRMLKAHMRAVAFDRNTNGHTRPGRQETAFLPDIGDADDIGEH